jgi:uncharacterized membrane protein
MEIVLFAVILIIVIILRNNISENNVLVRNLGRSVDDLENEIKRLNQRLSETDVPKTTEAPSPVIKPGPVAEPVKPGPAVPVIKRTEHPVTKEPVREGPVMIVEAPSYRPQPRPARPPQEGWMEKWLRNNPDIEKFIGENLINKIGIAVLVLGIAFFVKYAIDQEWINEQGRVGIGLLCGGILIGLAHRLRNSYRSFSSVLVGGGLTVFYFTIAIAFHEYKLLGQTPAFICMVVITTFAVVLSVLYDRIELAILATIGGFITPFLLTTGKENYIALFTYLAVLNGGLIILGYFKQWRILNFISLFFTLVIYGAWFNKHITDDTFPFKNAFIFATIFYFLFLAMNLISQFSVKDKLKAFDFGILLVINITYYSAGLAILEEAGLLQYKGIFTASLGVLNLVLAYSLFRSKNLDKNFIYLLIGLTITYISLTAPVQLEGNHITLFWAAEAVLLLWLYQRSFIKLVKLAAVVVTACMLISLMMDWVQVYAYGPAEILPVVINKGVITTLFASISLLLSHFLLRKEADSYYLAGVTNGFMRTTYISVADALLLIIGLVEINYQFVKRYPDTGLQYIYLQLYAVSFFTILFIVAGSFKWKPDEYFRAMVTGVLFALYLANTANVYRTETGILASGDNTIHLVAIVVNTIVVFSLLVHTFFYISRNRERYQSAYTTVITLLSLAFVTVLSIEIRNAYIWSTYDGPSRIGYFENLYAKALLTIIWGLSSFAMIWLGMKYRFKSLRITALVLFGITLVKLFSFDIRNIPPAGKIAAFILLGVLLLVVSFMYQRLKKLIIDNAEAE